MSQNRRKTPRNVVVATAGRSSQESERPRRGGTRRGFRGPVPCPADDIDRGTRMAGSAPCPECGARNDLGVRRCRVCAALLDAGAPEDAGGSTELPEHVQRWMNRDMARDEAPAADAWAGSAPPPPPGPLADEDRFDPDALFRDIGRPAAPLPPPPPGSAPPAPRPPPGTGAPWAVDVPDGASGEEIERATAQAIREERLRKRPGFLDRIFTEPRDEDT
jgi:hypothetical protein